MTDGVRRCSQLGRSNYEVLVDALGDMCVRELAASTGEGGEGGADATDGMMDEDGQPGRLRRGWCRVASRGEVLLSSDEDMLSPRNGFVSAAKVMLRDDV